MRQLCIVTISLSHKRHKRRHTAHSPRLFVCIHFVRKHLLQLSVQQMWSNVWNENKISFIFTWMPATCFETNQNVVWFNISPLEQRKKKQVSPEVRRAWGLSCLFCPCPCPCLCEGMHGQAKQLKCNVSQHNWGFHHMHMLCALSLKYSDNKFSFLSWTIMLRVVIYYFLQLVPSFHSLSHLSHSKIFKTYLSKLM